MFVSALLGFGRPAQVQSLLTRCGVHRLLIILMSIIRLGVLVSEVFNVVPLLVL